MNLKDITVEMIEQIIDKNNIENKNIVVKDFINTIVINELFSIGLKTLL